tara:strand:- start:1717 stop:2349 length:633 start_codon:yes stop_codon:yes gene_type:complete
MVFELIKYGTIVGCMTTIFFTSCFFVSPDPVSDTLRHETSLAINKVFLDMEKRQQRGANNMVDKFVLNVVYGSMIASTAFVYPESSMNLAHYLYGDGSDLKLPNRYLKKSPVVRQSLRRSSYGVNGPFSFRQTEDKRLSYVYNPFSLKVTGEGDLKKVKIYQRMVFAKPNPHSPVRTTFWLGKFSFKMSDSLVYVVGNCKPFTAYAVWYE